jgi:hypothetical protein
MRVAFAALLICAGAPVFCQTLGQTPAGQTAAGPGESGQKLTDLLQPQNEIGKGPTTWHMTLDGLLTVPPGMARVRMPGAPTDPKMVVHPPQGSIGVQAPGTQVAQNLYPGLVLMPIEQATVKVEPIPTTWPNMKLEKIPTAMPQYTMLPVQSGSATKKPAPAK